MEERMAKASFILAKILNDKNFMGRGQTNDDMVDYLTAKLYISSLSAVGDEVENFLYQNKEKEWNELAAICARIAAEPFQVFFDKDTTRLESKLGWHQTQYITNEYNRVRDHFDRVYDYAVHYVYNITYGFADFDDFVRGDYDWNMEEK